MSRPLMTAWATISSIALYDASGFHQRRASVRLREDACQIAVLPLHPDRIAVDVFAIRPELHFPAGGHRCVTRRDVECRESVTYFLRIGRPWPFKRIGDDEGLRDQATGIFEEEVPGSLLVFDVHLLRVGIHVVVPVRHALQAFREFADVLVAIGIDETTGTTVGG